MAGFELSSAIPDDFANVVRLFPLPNLVLFPGVMQPLHIFEPRYCEMLEDALADDHLIAIATLAPGWEDDYAGRPPIASTACLGRIVTHARAEGGTHNILLLGLRRARLFNELPPIHSYRTAEIRLLEDVYSARGAAARPDLHRKLLEAFGRFAPKSLAVRKQFDQLFKRQVPLGMLADIFAYALQLDIAFKQQLLDECDVDRRVALLIPKLSELLDDPPRTPHAMLNYPPRFSDN